MIISERTPLKEIETDEITDEEMIEVMSQKPINSEEIKTMIIKKFDLKDLKEREPRKQPTLQRFQIF